MVRKLHLGIMDNRDEEKSGLCAKALIIEQRPNLPDRLQRADLCRRDAHLAGGPARHRDWRLLADQGANSTRCPRCTAGRKTASCSTNRSRRIGLPVVDKLHKTLTFHAWYPGCPMEEDAYGIPSPRTPKSSCPRCCSCPAWATRPGGYRLGYGGGFYDRTLATLQPCQPFTVGWVLPTVTSTTSSPSRDLPLDAMRGLALGQQPAAKRLDLRALRARGPTSVVGHGRVEPLPGQWLDQVAIGQARPPAQPGRVPGPGPVSAACTIW